jgi:hypothetical protein
LLSDRAMTTRTDLPIATIRFLVFLSLSTSACRAPSHGGIDLEGPILLGSDLVAGEERGPSDPIRLWFSDPIAPGALDERGIVLVPFELGALCSHAMGCQGGWRCHRGRCQRDPISKAWLSDLATPPLSAARLAQTVPLCGQLDESATELTLWPLHPLAPHRLHMLLVGSVRDRAGNLVQLPGPGAEVALQEVLATAGSDRAHPSLELRSPTAGEAEVPTNLARIVVQTSRAVCGLVAGSIWLELPTGERIDLLPRQSSALCQASAPRTCHELLLAGPLPPLSRVELRASPTVTDDQGRPLHEAELPGPGETAFATGPAPDLSPPRLEALELVEGDRCVVVRARSSELGDLTLVGDWPEAKAAGVGSIRHELGVAAPEGWSGQLSLVLSDLAGNRAFLPPLAVDGGAPPPRIVISEVLANPAGPEPAQELIELVNLESHPVDLAGFQIDDGDDGIGVDLLPATVLGPGGYAVVVGAKFSQDGHADPLPAASAVLVRLSGTLGDGGLGNASERIALRNPGGRLVSSYGAHHGSLGNGQSVERRDLRACDLAKSWRPRPDGRSSPGWPADGDGAPESGW